MGNPAAGVLVLLAALYLLLAFFRGDLEWLFAASGKPAAIVEGLGQGTVGGGAGAVIGAPDPPNPTTTGNGGAGLKVK
jgi:hypothetical protein